MGCLHLQVDSVCLGHTLAFRSLLCSAHKIQSWLPKLCLPCLRGIFTKGKDTRRDPPSCQTCALNLISAITAYMDNLPLNTLETTINSTSTMSEPKNCPLTPLPDQEGWGLAEGLQSCLDIPFWWPAFNRTERAEGQKHNKEQSRAYPTTQEGP